MIEGLASTGMSVTDIGEVLTPTVYFASASYDGAGAGVMITGSHLDTRYNGIKMAYGKTGAGRRTDSRPAGNHR